MAISPTARPLNRSQTGFGATDVLPITGSTKLAASAQDINDRPELFNQWFRAQPWYQAAMQAWGQNPNDPHLTMQQRFQLQDAAKRAGVDTAGGNGAFGIDTNGRFEDTSMPTWTKVALAATGGLAGASALGAFGGAATIADAASGASYGPLAAGYGAATTSAAVPGSLAAAGGGGALSTIGNIARVAAGGKPGGTMGAWDWVGPAIQVGTQLYGANQQANALSDQSAAQIQAAKYAADLQAKSSQSALDFQKQTAEGDYRNQEIARQGNYGQWAARAGRLSDFGRTVGLPAREIPAYVPGEDPNYTGAGPATIAGAAQTPQAPPQDPAALAVQAQEGFKRVFGREGTPEEINQVVGYGSKPDLYSDGKWRIGVNDYLITRVGTKSASADPRLAGTAGIIAGPTAQAQPRPGPLAPTIGGAGTGYLTSQATPALQMPGTIAGMR